MKSIFVRPFSIFTFIAVLLSGCASDDSTNLFAKERGVEIATVGETLRVVINGKEFTRYHFQKVPRPFLYPVFGPGDLAMTRHWPMQEAPNEERDHPHHRSFWFTHGNINGHDFWSESANAGRVVHKRFLEIRSGRKEGMIQSSNQYIARDGQIVGTDSRTLRFHALATNRIVDYEITFHASHGELILGDTKEGSMALRVAESMRLKRKGQPGKGHIVMSTGLRDGETWGKRAAWCDYYGPVENEIVGVAIFDHPENPRHPTWWHVRDYGLFAANPFGIHDFEKKEKEAGTMKVASGDSVTFRYRIYFHKGDEKEAEVARYYDAYKAGKVSP